MHKPTDGSPWALERPPPDQSGSPRAAYAGAIGSRIVKTVPVFGVLAQPIVP
jgi:hypothetical protein